MSISDLNASQLSQLVRLLEEKQALKSKLEKINRSLASFSSETEKTGRKAIRVRRISDKKDKGVKAAVLKVLLQEKGTDGLTIKEIARRGKLNLGSVSTWIYTEGKTIDGLRNINRGKFIYTAEDSKRS